MKILDWLSRRRKAEAPREPTEAEAEAYLKSWVVARVVNEELGEAGVLRIRLEKPALDNFSEFNTAISINWRYGSNFPEGKVNERMLDFERAIDDLTWYNGFSELVQVSTGMGLKEWLFYSTDRKRFMAELNKLLEGHPEYPLEIELYDDPQWQIWEEMAQTVAAREKSSE